MHLLIQSIEQILHFLVVLQVNPVFERLGEKGFCHPPILGLACLLHHSAGNSFEVIHKLFGVLDMAFPAEKGEESREGGVPLLRRIRGLPILFPGVK